jgi:hypothetical protein
VKQSGAEPDYWAEKSPEARLKLSTPPTVHSCGISSVEPRRPQSCGISSVEPRLRKVSTVPDCFAVSAEMSLVAEVSLVGEVEEVELVGAVVVVLLVD